MGGVNPSLDAGGGAIADREGGWGGTAREDVDFDRFGKAGEFLPELVAPGDLEGDHRHLPWSSGRFQRLLQTTHVKDEDARCAQFGGPPDRDGADEAAVEVVLTVDLDGRQQAGHRTRRQHGRRHQS